MATNINKVVIPSLSEDGWVFSSKKQADYLMAYFLASDYSQSYIHKNQVSSFGWMISKYGNQPAQLISQMESVLRTLFNRYFNNVEVEVSDSTNPEEPSKFILSIFVQFQLADGSVENIARITQINGSRFEIIRKAIND